MKSTARICNCRDPDRDTLSGTALNPIYTLASGYAGLDGFSFVVNDGELDSAEAIVSITINYDVYVPVTFR